MANTLRQGGLKLVDAVDGAGSGLEIILVPTGDTHATGLGDPLSLSAATQAKIGSGPLVASCAQATSTSVIYGVVLSALPQYIDGTATMNLGQVYRTASTAEYMLIRIGNNKDIYEICDDGVLAGMAAGHLAYNYKTVPADCSTSTGLSAFLIDSNNGATTATYQLKVQGPVDDPTNDPTLASARWRVSLNNVVRSGSTGTVGI